METERTAQEISRLRRCINDLASLLALPAMWTGHDCSRLISTLLALLVRMLDLDFAYARIADPANESPREWMRSADSINHHAEANEIGRALEPYLAAETPTASFRIANPVANGTVSVAVFYLGMQERVGVLAAASRRSEFPTETERLLLQVATNQAAIALQEAGRVAQRDAKVQIERTRTQAALQESEKRFQQMADSIPEMIRLIIDSTPALIHTALPDGYIDFFNHTWLQYVGLPLEDIQGWNWTSAIHPDDVEGILKKWRASLASGEPFLHETRVRTASGEYRWMLHHKIAQRDESGKIVKWYGSSIDIEERKTAEEKIREQERELREILELTPQHIGVFEPDGNPLYANHAALEYFGITIDQWCAEGSRLDLVHPDEREHFLAERKNRFLEGAPHEFEARLLRHDGKFRWFLFRLNPLKDERGHITRWYGTAIDIENRKRTEEGIRKENIALREEIVKTSMFEEIVGSSEALRKVLLQVAKVAPTDSTVLITGETGTGKELLARAIHKRSRRSSRAFVSVNCAAIPQSLIASELFGHEKGAFTGALQRRLGRFELAEGGTIFLDEIGDLPADTQNTLLRVLQEREFERVGGTQLIRANVRVIAATNRDLKSAMANGTFRRDLFYRLNVFPIEIPSLRERKEDIPVLVKYFMDRYASKAGKTIRRVNKNSLELLQSYPWPGNIRELQNVIERSVIVCESENLMVDKNWLAQEPVKTQLPTGTLSEELVAREKERIEAALAETGGRVSGPLGAAAKLGIPRSTLDSKIRSLKINTYRFKTL